MHRTRTGRRALVVVACALVALAAYGIAAWAFEGDGWVSRTGERAGANSLTVRATGVNAQSGELSEADAAFVADLATADVVVDVYQVATATKQSYSEAYDYALGGSYRSDDNDALLASALRGATTGAWQELAAALAPTATLTAEGSIPAGGTLERLDPGIYLVLAHGRGITDAAQAVSATYAYTFSPALVAVPAWGTSAAEMADPTAVTIDLKCERAPRYGSVQVVKTTVDKAGKPAAVQGDPVTFNFNIHGTQPDGTTYDNYLAVTLQPGESSGTSTVLGHIPAGTTLTVTEVYGGGRYQQVGAVTADAGTTVRAGETLVFRAVNTPTSRIYGGNGVQNGFVYNQKGTGDWDFTQTPHVPDNPQAN